MSYEELRYGQSIARALSEMDQKSKIAVLIRHSEREHLEREEEDVPLTEDGKQCARIFGQNLAWTGSLALKFSPKRRCDQTAKEIAKGYRDSNPDAEISMLGSEESLAALLHSDKFRPEVDDLLGQLIRAAYDGSTDQWGLTEDMVDFSEKITQDILRAIYETIERGPDDTLHIYVDHDLHLMVLIENIWGGRFATKNWIEYLDGILLTSEEDASWTAMAGGLKRDVSSMAYK